jgi:hypothetical protein
MKASTHDFSRMRLEIAVIAFFILAATSLLVVIHHWHWLFWLLLVAFSGSALQIPITLLQMTGVLPSSDPLWYNLFRMGAGVVELALAVWMIHIYRHEGVWGRGQKRHEG